VPKTLLQRPFTGGINTELPPHLIKQDETVECSDAMAPNGVLTTRRGWQYDGTVADAAADLISIWKAKFIIADVTKTLTFDENGVIRVHASAGAGTTIMSGVAEYLPRCMYRDELIMCCQDGITPFKRWSGATTAGTLFDDTASALVIGQATIPGIQWSANPDIGAYIYSNQGQSQLALVGHRILEYTTTSVTVEDTAHVTGGNTPVISRSIVGTPFPCVSIYNAGSTTISAGTVTGVGTKWTTVSVINGQDAILRVDTTVDPDAYDIKTIYPITDDDTLTAFLSTDAVSQPYDIVRPCPFKDAAAHQGSLWGAGVAQYPNRVYVSPPGWNPALPPGAVAPYKNFDEIHRLESRNDYLLDFVDVPTPYEGDNIVAILPSSNPLLVLKRDDVYGIYGSHPTLTTQLIAEGKGCVHIQSAKTLPMGPVWCGDNGIFTYQNGRVVDLTSGRRNREWRELMRQSDASAELGTDRDRITTGQYQDHLFVTIHRGPGSNFDITWIFDIRNGVWISDWTNHFAADYFSESVTDESSELYWVDGAFHQGRVMKSKKCFSTRAELSTEHNVRDADNHIPVFYVKSGSNLSGRELDEESKMIDLAVTAIIYDIGADGTTGLSVTANALDKLYRDYFPDLTNSKVFSNTIALSETVHRNYFRNVNLRGRGHNIELGTSPFNSSGSNLSYIDLYEIIMTFQGTADRT
jgi:hypothetical protein